MLWRGRRIMIAMCIRCREKDESDLFHSDFAGLCNDCAAIEFEEVEQ
jgi:hypothetical protein